MIKFQKITLDTNQSLQSREWKHIYIYTIWHKAQKNESLTLIQV